MIRSEKVANIKIDKKQFFYKWVEFTQPFHKLRKRSQETLALLLYHHYELSSVIKNNTILWKQVFDYDTKVKIMTEMGIPQSGLENLLTELRKCEAKVIVNNQIQPVFIPNIDRDTTDFTLKINFKFND